MAATENFQTYVPALDSPYTHAFAITPADGSDLSNVTRAIYVGGAGNIALITSDGDTVTLTGALVGVIYRVRASRVKSTGTTATNLVGLY